MRVDPGAAGGPRARRSRARTHPSTRTAARARGFTLVEVLVALALAALLAGVLGAALAGGARVAGRVAEGGASAQRRALAWALVRHEIEMAGRGVDAGGLAVEADAGSDGGDRLRVRYLAAAHRSEPVHVDAWFFAAEDGAGRPNLYRMPAGGVRQPWLLGVEAIRVVAGRAEDGSRVTRTGVVPGARLVALEVEIRFADGATVRRWASLARSGTLDDPVAPSEVDAAVRMHVSGEAGTP